MKRSSLGLLAAPFLLVACGTPQEQCIRAETRELRTVENLIASTRADIARGYTYVNEEITRTEWVICEYIPQQPTTPGGPTPPPKPRYCLDDVTETVRKPAAIDPVAEQRKLSALEAKRKELSARAESAIAACRQKYPEGA